jgi:hypothetical protein
LSENDCVVNTSFNVLNTSSTNQISDTNVNNDSSLLVDTDVTDIGNVSRNCHYENTCNLNTLNLNCCGVKLRLQYPAFCKLVCNQDTICLQETKTDDLDTIELPGYIAFPLVCG